MKKIMKTTANVALYAGKSIALSAILLLAFQVFRFHYLPGLLLHPRLMGIATLVLLATIPFAIYDHRKRVRNATPDRVRDWQYSNFADTRLNVGLITGSDHEKFYQVLSGNAVTPWLRSWWFPVMVISALVIVCNLAG